MPKRGPKKPGDVKRKLIDRDGPGCVVCGVEIPQRRRGGTRLTIDHVVPLSEGGSNGLDNLRLMCRPCQDERHAVPPRGLIV